VPLGVVQLSVSGRVGRIITTPRVSRRRWCDRRRLARRFPG
jgi:hypothetical protein